MQSIGTSFLTLSQCTISQLCKTSKTGRKGGGYKINLKPELMRGINISEGRISDNSCRENNFDEL